MGESILVVEDHEHNLYLVSFLLEHAGYRVLQARDGEQALRALEEHVPTAILLDVQLPGMDGLELLSRLRGRPALANVVVVAVTSYAMSGDRDGFLAAGCDAYLEKPIDSTKFVGQIQTIIRRGR